MQDRAEAQGYTGSVNENVGLSGSMLSSLDWFMNTINHRLPIIDPRYTDVGLATVNEGEIIFEVINFGMPEYSQDAQPAWVIWPPDGTTGAGRSFWGEAPNPFPGATFPTGLPITLSFFGGGDISLSSWSIQSDGVEAPSFGGVGDGFLSGRAALITASAPLEYGTTYTVSASGEAGGQPYSHTFSFTTQIDEDETLALDGYAPPDDEALTPPDPSPEPTVAETPPAPPTVAVDPNSPFPAGVQNSPASVQTLWWEFDGPVYRDEVERSWLWGMDVWALGEETYADAATGEREVYYFDKARVEIADPEAEVDPELLTTGLLVRDMILGSTQTGDDEFLEIGPAEIPLAGDPLEFNADAPTYASLHGVATLDGDNLATPRFGEDVVATLERNGATSTNPRLAGYSRYGSYYPAIGHNVATVFESYFATLPTAWWEAVGLPITEPYWVTVKVSGELRWVLVQAFERRLLTFTPSNEPEWQVEMGNVGRHYYAWRYGVEPPSS
jgi:hypothetical protein